MTMSSPSSLSYASHRHRQNPQRRLFLIIAAMSTFLLFLFFLSLYFSLFSSSRHHHYFKSGSSLAQIDETCKATRYTDLCISSLSKQGHLPANPNPLQIIQSAISVASDNLKTSQSMVKTILDESAGNQNRTNACNTCLQLFSMSEYRTQSTADALTRGKIKDGRSWLSAALAYQYDCWGGLKYVNDTKSVLDAMVFLNYTMIGSTSNALSMLMSYDNFGDNVGSWISPMTERDGFWDKPTSFGGESVAEPTVPQGLTPTVTVCKDGSNGCYKTVQEAVNACPDNDGGSKFVILIKEGVYDEIVRVGIEKKKVVFLGEGMGRTIITGSLNVGQPGMTTYNSATVGVLGDGFMARDLTIRNTAGGEAHQAVAFRSDSDLSVLENCELLGNQDTLYSHSLRQYYKSCIIQGNVDFIFGNSAAVFQDCKILVAPRSVNPEKGENNALTAHGRTDPAQTTGYVFRNCLINGTEEYMKFYHANPTKHKNYLGRPWKEFSRTVFIQCNLEALLTAEGWMPWSGDFALETLYYGEYKNSGPGSDTSKRVPWSTQVPDEHVITYSVQNFIQGDQWSR